MNIKHDIKQQFISKNNSITIITDDFIYFKYIMYPLTILIYYLITGEFRYHASLEKSLIKN